MFPAVSGWRLRDKFKQITVFLKQAPETCWESTGRSPDIKAGGNGHLFLKFLTARDQGSLVLDSAKDVSGNREIWLVGLFHYASSLRRSPHRQLQSRSQSFVPLDQRSENESSGSIHFEITMGNNRIPFSSPEAALLLVSTKNRDLWPSQRSNDWAFAWTRARFKHFRSISLFMPQNSPVNLRHSSHLGTKFNHSAPANVLFPSFTA